MWRHLYQGISEVFFDTSVESMAHWTDGPRNPHSNKRTPDAFRSTEPIRRMTIIGAGLGIIRDIQRGSGHPPQRNRSLGP
jgi:hypothetical protein